MLRTALLHAVAVSWLILLLFLYWFGAANRYIVFLYGHLGLAPFDPPTISRYWMSGLVASGVVLVTYTYGNWLWGRIRETRGQRYVPPLAWKVWALSLPMLLPGILWITMHLNWPTLTLRVALVCAGITALGLLFALLPARMATTAPHEFFQLTLAGLGLMPALLLLRLIERINWGKDGPTYAMVGVASTVAGALWTLGLSMWYARQQRAWKTSNLLISGLCWTYLLLPLAHYLFFTPPGFRYISVADNFFATTPAGQVLAFLVAGGIAYGASVFQRRITQRSFRR